MDWDQALVLRQAAARESLQRIRGDQVGAPADVGRALEVIAERLFDAKLKVKSLKLACQIRDNSFSLRFHQHCGRPPVDYLAKRRIDTAAVLLESEPISVGQVAELTGFNSLQVFSDAFLRWMEARPLAYRQGVQRLVSVANLELLNPGTLRLACLGRLEPKPARRLIGHLQDLYATDEPVAGPDAAASEICDSEQQLATGHWRVLQDLPPGEQQNLVKSLPLRSAALFHLLLQQCRSEGRQDRKRGVQIAELALDALHATGRYLPPKKLLELKAKGWAWLGNAQRLNLDLKKAEASFATSAWHLPAPNTDRRILAEHCELLASLRWYQRRMDTAAELQDRAVALQRTIGDLVPLAKALIVRGILSAYSGQTPWRDPNSQEALLLLDPSTQPLLSFAAQFNLAVGQLCSGEHEVVWDLLPQAQELASQVPGTSASLRLRWLEGLLHHANGDSTAAVRILDEVCCSFFDAEDTGHFEAARIDLAAAKKNLSQPLILNLRTRRNFAAAHLATPPPSASEAGKHRPPR